MFWLLAAQWVVLMKASNLGETQGVIHFSVPEATWQEKKKKNFLFFNSDSILLWINVDIKEKKAKHKQRNWDIYLERKFQGKYPALP